MGRLYTAGIGSEASSSITSVSHEFFDPTGTRRVATSKRSPLGRQIGTPSHQNTWIGATVWVSKIVIPAAASPFALYTGSKSREPAIFQSVHHRIEFLRRTGS